MKLIKNKNKIRWNQTEKFIIDPTLDFKKRLDVQSLSKKFGKHCQKIYDLHGLKNRKLVSFL